MSTYSVTILGNVEECRTEAEISRNGQLVAIVFESSDGWHTNIVKNQSTLRSGDFDDAVVTARQALSHYVNRRGTDPPQGVTRGAFALWLMMKDGGNAMGVSLKDDKRQSR